MSDLKLTPACLRTVLRGLDTEHRLLTVVLLALDASWLTSSSLDIRGYRLTLDNREICSHACYSWVYYLRLFRGLVLRLFRGLALRLFRGFATLGYLPSWTVCPRLFRGFATLGYFPSWTVCPRL